MSKEKETTENNMILVEAGRFEMGEKLNTKLVTITKDFYICKYLVTFDEYDEFSDAMDLGRASDEGWGRGIMPVVNVDWYDAVEYCNWMSRKEKGLEEVYTINKSEKDINNENVYEDDWLKWIVTCDFNKKGYRLPTEAEWEFAARGGNKSKGFKYSGSNEINEVAWYHDNNTADNTKFIGLKKSNELGIHDMSGNVFEWCWDWYKDDEPEGYDPKGAKTGWIRVNRGGYWNDSKYSCEVAERASSLGIPRVCSRIIGFRIVRTC